MKIETTIKHNTSDAPPVPTVVVSIGEEHGMVQCLIELMPSEADQLIAQLEVFCREAKAIFDDNLEAQAQRR